jgi:enterochelin esterase-like enzyme
MPIHTRRTRRPGSRSRLHVEALEPRRALAATPYDESWQAVLAPPPGPPAMTTLATPVAPSLAVQPAVATGPFTHDLVSPFQRTPTRVRVLLPATYSPARTYRTLYVLPVEPGNGTNYGDGLRVIEKAGLQDLHDVIVVAPSFSDMPWYGDHPTKTTIRQESHLLQVVIPFVEAAYAVSRQPADRVLVGFSKSGYGAFSLLLRHPDQFGTAVAWDAPLALGSPRSDWGMPKIYGSNANFANYRVTKLIERQASILMGGPARLILAGSSTFRADHAQVRRQLERLGVPHEFVDGPRHAHAWGSGWLPAAIHRGLARR